MLIDTVKSMFNDLHIDADHTSVGFEKLSAVDSRYLRDLKLNVAGVLKAKNIDKKEAALLALSVAINEKSNVLISAFEQLARNEGANDEEVAETHACTSLMNFNNVFYRFRHYMDGVDYYNNTSAGVRMSVMMNPVMGKQLFELMSLVISALNGCQRCVVSHEHSVKEHGASEAKVYDAVRLAGAIKSLAVIA